ncbi:nitronate monooxygenase family protein [Virgisporangium ochraceum]
MTTTWPTDRLVSLLGIEHPVVQGPFGGGASSVALATAVSNAGGLGSFGAHALRPDEITDLVTALRAATDRPFAVNLWVPQPSEVTDVDLAPHVERLRPLYERTGSAPPSGHSVQSFDDQLAAALDAAPPVLSFVMGVPPAAALDTARRKGIRTVGTASTVEEAEALAAAGLDVVVASGSDAGGHRGAFLRPVEESLVGTFSLVPQVVDAVDVPVVAAGGIADGRGVAAAFALGAHGVQIGTGFLNTVDSNASKPHRRALNSTDARRTVLTRVFSGRLARGIANRVTRDLAGAEREVPAYPVQNALMMPIRAAAADRGDPVDLNLWSGQAAPLTRETTAVEYLTRLVREAQALLRG